GELRARLGVVVLRHELLCLVEQCLCELGLRGGRRLSEGYLRRKEGQTRDTRETSEAKRLTRRRALQDVDSEYPAVRFTIRRLRHAPNPTFGHLAGLGDWQATRGSRVRVHALVLGSAARVARRASLPSRGLAQRAPRRLRWEPCSQGRASLPPCALL